MLLPQWGVFQFLDCEFWERKKTLGFAVVSLSFLSGILNI